MGRRRTLPARERLSRGWLQLGVCRAWPRCPSRTSPLRKPRSSGWSRRVNEKRRRRLGVSSRARAGSRHVHESVYVVCSPGRALHGDASAVVKTDTGAMVSGFRSMDVEAANGEEEPLRGGEPPSQAPGTSTLFRGRKQRWRWSWDWHWVVFATTLAGALTGAIIIGLYAAPPANRHHRALPNVIIDPFVARDWRGRPRSVRGTRGVVASDAGACSALGASVLDLGGNAIDAAVATTICEGVVNPSASGIGGGCFLLYRGADGTAEVINAREYAPASASVDMYAKHKEQQQRGGKAVAVPLELLGLRRAWERHGKLPWKSLLEPSIRLAEQGFPAHVWLAVNVELFYQDIAADPAFAEAFLVQDADGTRRPPHVGEHCCKRPALAATLRAVADQGPDVLYRGPMAATLVDELNAHGGAFTLDDLRQAEVEVVEPVKTEVFGMTYLGVGPPSSGGAAVATILQIMAGYAQPVSSQGPLEAHRLTEAFKHAFAARTYLGDPGWGGRTFKYSPRADVEAVLTDMLSSEYADTLRAAINDNTTLPTKDYGGKWAPDFAVREDHGTTGLAVVSEDSDAVAVTSTINTPFGAFLMSPSTGIIFNNEMDDFSTPDAASAFDLAPHPANFIEPGKRPLSSMSPSIVVDASGVRAVASASGGPRIITAVAQTLLRLLGDGAAPLAAVAGPRMHHQLEPNRAELESLHLKARASQLGIDVAAIEAWRVPEAAVVAATLGTSYDWWAAARGYPDADGDGLPVGVARGQAGVIAVPGKVAGTLSSRGHNVAPGEMMGVCQLIAVDLETGIRVAVSDPRKDGAPAAQGEGGKQRAGQA